MSFDQQTSDKETLSEDQSADEIPDVSPDEEVSNERCAELRQLRKDGYEYMDIASKSNLDSWDVVAHIRGKCSCDSPETAITEKSDKPWAEKELVRVLFIEKNMDYTEIAELFDCHHETVKNWARDKHEITIIEDSIQTSSKTVRQMLRIGIQSEDDTDLPPEARKSPFGNSKDSN